MEHHSHLSQSRGVRRCGGGDGPTTSEKKVPRRPEADTPTVAEVPTISTPRVEIEKKPSDQPPSANGQIWPKGPPDTD
mgnify:CR=1 FL=1